MRPKTATEAASALLSRTRLPIDGLDRHGAPGTPCYLCGSVERWRLGEGYPWVCSICHPKEGIR